VSVSSSDRQSLAMSRLRLLTSVFDSETLLLYVSIRQIFSLALFPFHHANVALTTVLHLTTDKPSIASDPSSPYSEISQPTKESQNLLHGQPNLYRIAKQEDLYQPSELIKFLPTYGIGHLLILMLQYWNTLLSLLGAIVGYPVTAYLEMRNRKIKGDDY
jgi:hypothetical protein